MHDDPVARARLELQRAETAVRDLPGDAGARIAEAIGAVHATLDRLLEAEKQTAEMQRNLAAQQAILDERLLRVETNRLFTAWNALAGRGREFSRRAKTALGGARANRPDPDGSPDPGRKGSNADYAKWVTGEQASLPSVEQARAVAEGWKSRPTFSVVSYIGSGEGLAATLESMQNQAYRCWELCLSIDDSRKTQALPLVRDFEAKGGNVRCEIVTGLDPGGALNAAAALATGDYLSLADEGGRLSRFALYSIAEALQSESYDVIYGDEDTVDAQGRRTDPVFKPEWSPDLLTSCMYIGRLVTVSRELFVQAGGLRPGYGGAGLHDLVMRLTDVPRRVHRVARVLYHRGPKAADDQGTARAVEDAIARREGTAAECVPGPAPSTFLVRRKSPGGDTTAIVCSRSAELTTTCLASLRATAAKAVSRVIVVAHEESGLDQGLRKAIQKGGATAVSFSGVFNFAAMNNLGARHAETRNLLFLNDDVEATAPGWAEMLNEQVARTEVGVAGAVLWYPSGVLQHAGVVAGIGDGVGHVGRYAPGSGLWPWLLATRNVSAVTGACLAMRKDLFDAVGGFDAVFPNNYNDVDLCFRVRERGLAVVCVPAPGVVHRECQSRRGIVRFEERFRFYKRWAALLGQPDPYYSPSLAPTEEIALNLAQDQWLRPLLVAQGGDLS